MFNILYRALIIVLIIVLGYLAKAIGLFSIKMNFSTISNLILYITLPSVIITNLNGLRFPPALLALSLIGFLSNWFYIFLAKIFGRTSEESSFMALNINGYNIGNFALPFITYFLGSGIPTLAISLFDVGSTLMVLGGNYVVAASLKDKRKKQGFFETLKVLLTTPTIVVYFIMIILSLMSLNMPIFIVDIAEIIGSANTFLAMFLIGISLEFNFNKNNLKKISKYMLLRYIPAVIFSFLMVSVPFLVPEMKYALATLLLAPVASSATIFTNLLENDIELSAQLNSFSILFSIVLMSTFMLVLNNLL